MERNNNVQIRWAYYTRLALQGKWIATSFSPLPSPRLFVIYEDLDTVIITQPVRNPCVRTMQQHSPHWFHSSSPLHLILVTVLFSTPSSPNHRNFLFFIFIIFAFRKCRLRFRRTRPISIVTRTRGSSPQRNTGVQNSGVILRGAFRLGSELHVPLSFQSQGSRSPDHHTHPWTRKKKKKKKED